MAETLLAIGVGTAGASGTAAGATLFGSTAAFSALTMAPTLLSVGGSIAGGFQGAAVSKMQTRQAELAAKQEELKGRETAATIRRQLNASLASQNAIFAARGIAPGGTTQTISNESSSQAARDIEIARFGAAQSAGALRSQAQQYQVEGSAKKLSGFADAGKSFYSLVK